MLVGSCPTPDNLARLLGEELAEADRTTVEAHVQTCAVCQERLERLVGGATSTNRPSTVVRAAAAEPDEAFMDRLRQLPLPPPQSEHATREMEPSVPPSLGPYEILGRLGRGGMGTVYRARHRELDKVVALKVLPAERVNESMVARFRNEMKATGRLAHPNIVTAHDAGRVGATYYLAMDFVDGTNLSDLVKQLGALPIPDACALVQQAATGLQHACESGLAHRDVKPSNLMLARGGVVKVLDLGLARTLADLPEPDRLTAAGMVLGTADYLAPEQIDQAHTADTRSDVYGLGGTLYFLLTGAPPFSEHRTWLEKLRAHATSPIPPVRQRRPEVPAALAALLERMLAKAPNDRPATPGEVADALGPFVAGADLTGLLNRGGLDSPVRRSTDPPVAGRRRGFRRAALRYVFAALAGAAIALVAAVPFLVRGRERAPEPPEPPGGDPPGAPPVKAEKKEDPEEVEGIRLTYGSGGPPRPDHRVLPGEQIFVEYFARVGTDRKGEVDLALAGELVDKVGKKWTELAPSPIRGPMYRNGPQFYGGASFTLDAQQAPGDYVARLRLTDKVNGRSVNFEHSVYVLRPEFGAVRLRLSHDKDGKWPAGGNMTVGQEFFLQGRAVSYTRKERRIHVFINVSAWDREGNDTTPAPLKPLNFNQEVDDNFIYFDFAFGPLRAVMAGDATIRVEMADRIGDKKAKYELPVLIHPPRTIRASKTEQ